MFEWAYIAVGALAGAGVAVAVAAMRWRGGRAPITETRIVTLAERVRAVGKLVGLEVCAKEIATSTKGWSWMPQLLLSQAKAAMIFHFEKQYFVDLARLGDREVGEIAPGRWRVRLPGLEGTLRLTEVTPYDIQAGRILGLIDVIQMDAATQKQLMLAAQQQASSVFTGHEARYIAEAKRSIERQLTTFLQMFGATVEVVWSDEEPRAVTAPVRLAAEAPATSPH
ncbi:MAG: DUF4230 domain-containing protein [Phycisphaerales bacterium]|nr:DUF4230 domain-containing protein [Phycisphaerales bacterium]